MSHRSKLLSACFCLFAVLAVHGWVVAEELVPPPVLPSAGDTSAQPIPRVVNESRSEKPAASDAKPASTPAEIAAWIKDLDDPRYEAREDATQHLVAAGGVALDPLLDVANGDRPEPADRAVWIMRRFGRSRDNDLALAALDHLVQLQNRPGIVAKAEMDLQERTIALCEQRLVPLGAELGLQIEQVEPPNVAPVLTVRLGQKWHGTPEDLRQVSQLRQQHHFRLEGAGINDEVVKMFAEKEKLSFLQLIDTKVTPDAVDAVKTHHPDALVYVRNQALLGVSGENHDAGVKVLTVQPGTAAAAAGIVAGDVIATIDGHKIPDFDRLTARVAQHQPGDKVDIEILHDDQRKTINVVLGSRAKLGQE